MMSFIVVVLVCLVGLTSVVATDDLMTQNAAIRTQTRDQDLVSRDQNVIQSSLNLRQSSLAKTGSSMTSNNDRIQVIQADEQIANTNAINNVKQLERESNIVTDHSSNILSNDASVNPSGMDQEMTVVPSDAQSDFSLSEYSNNLVFVATVTVLTNSKSGGDRLNLPSVNALGLAIYSALNLVNQGVSSSSAVTSTAFRQRLISTVVSNAVSYYTIAVNYTITVPEDASLFSGYSTFVSFYTVPQCCWTAGQVFYNTALQNNPLFVRQANISTVSFSNAAVIFTSPQPSTEPTSVPSCQPTVYPTPLPTSDPTTKPTSGPKSSASGFPAVVVIVVVIVCAIVLPTAFFIAYARFKKRSPPVVRRNNDFVRASSSRANIVDLDAAPVVVHSESILMVPPDLDVSLVFDDVAPVTASVNAVPVSSHVSVHTADALPRSSSQGSVRVASLSPRGQSSPRVNSSGSNSPHNSTYTAVNCADSSNNNNLDPLAAISDYLPREFSLRTFGLEWMDPNAASSNPNNSVNT